MKKSDKRQIFIAFFVVLILSISYLFFLYMYRLSITGEYNPNDLVIEFNSINNVEMNDSLPLSDKIGKTLELDDINDGIAGYIDFTIKNKSDMDVSYELYIIRNESKDEIDTRFVKLYLADASGETFGIYQRGYSPTYASLKYLKDKPEAKSIYVGELKGKEKKHLIIRSWVSDGYPIREKRKTFSYSIDVRPV